METHRAWLSSLLLALVVFLLSVACVEIGFRLARFDFEFKERAFEKVPIFYRQPVVPVGAVFFRRPGPAVWKGDVLTPLMRQAGVPTELLPDEPELSIFYDANGFRNPEELVDWDVVVVGDSFTELGYLPYEDLFTTEAGSLLELRIKNLGVSHTGPFTHAYYLSRYGGSPSARHAVLAFFEGSDVDDLVNEHDALATARRLRQSAKRSWTRTALTERIEPQSSFLKAMYRLITRAEKSPAPHLPNAWYLHGGFTTPVNVYYTPSSTASLRKEVRDLIGRALNHWAATARGLGMKPWILYLPSKRRVLHGRLRFSENASAEIASWEPSDLPDLVRSFSEQNGIGFIDAIPALRAEAAAGRLPYNPVWDTHLNRHGSLVVGRVLADALRPETVARAEPAATP